MKALARALTALGALLIPTIASAHEVYVLTPDEIREGISMTPFSAMGTIFANIDSFALSAFLAVLTVFVIFFASISHALEKAWNPFFAKAKHYGPAVARITIGLSFIAGAYFDAAYGPELPLEGLWGPYAFLARVILFITGVLICVGFYTRIAATIGVLFYLINCYVHGAYMLTYLNYLGELLVLLLIGAHRVGVDRYEPSSMRKVRSFFDRIAKKLAPYSFLILRVTFGISLLYASLYAKFLHNGLALEVATLPLAGHMYGLAHYFNIEPHFLVLGAGIIEVVIALFFTLGIEIRFTALFVEFWVMLSVWWFGEAVWPHIILLGIPLAFILYGYDKYSIEGMFFKKGNREPVF